MSKRKADEALTAPQAKHTCFKPPSWSPHEMPTVLETVTTPPPHKIEIDEAERGLNDENSLVARLEASQTKLVEHLDQKYRHMRSVDAEKACAMESRLTKLTEAMKILNQEINAMRADVDLVDHPHQPTTSCRDTIPTYFAPHQYVPLPQA